MRCRRHSPGLSALAAGLALALGLALLPAPASAQGLLERARDAVKEAGRQIEQAAEAAGRSVSEFLRDNPDLNRDIVEFGHDVGVPGFERPGPALGAGISVAPASAPAGATVVVTARGLPGDLAGIGVAIGPRNDDFEALDQGTTDVRGVLTRTVTVPGWAAEGDDLVFVVETPDERIRLISPPFKVAATEAGVLTVTGTLSTEGAECPALRGDDGTLYTLAGGSAVAGFKPGDRVTVIGKKAEISTCQQGTTLAVDGIAPAK